MARQQIAPEPKTAAQATHADGIVHSPLRRAPPPARARPGASASGQVPAVAYGKGLTVDLLAVSPKDVLGILTSERGENSVIQLGRRGAQASSS